MPFSVIYSTAFVDVVTLALFFALLEFTLVLLSRAIDIDAFSAELIIFPGSHITVFVREGVNSFSVAAIDVLTDVLAAVRIVYLLVLGLNIAKIIKKLA